MGIWHAGSRMASATTERHCFRVLYGIDEEGREVQIQAIGVKEGNRLLVGGEEVEL